MDYNMDDVDADQYMDSLNFSCGSPRTSLKLISSSPADSFWNNTDLDIVWEPESCESSSVEEHIFSMDYILELGVHPEFPIFPGLEQPGSPFSPSQKEEENLNTCVNSMRESGTSKMSPSVFHLEKTASCLISLSDSEDVGHSRAILQRQRRVNLKKGFDKLRQVIPVLSKNSSAPKQTILDQSLLYIRRLMKIEKGLASKKRFFLNLKDELTRKM